MTFFSQYELTSELVGRGTYAEVWKANRTRASSGAEEDSPKIVAVKRISKNRLVTSEERTMPQREIANHEAIGRHPHAVFMYDSFENDESVFLMLEMIEGGTLRERLDRNPLGLTQGEAGRAMRQLLLGVAHFHEKSLVHGDIKPTNILFEMDGTLKLCDFGMASSPTNSINSSFGTMGYTAPEVVNGSRSLDEKADVFSLGVVGYEMITGLSPAAFQVAGRVVFPEELWIGKSTLCRAFVESLVDVDPNNRPTVEMALNHLWFVEIVDSLALASPEMNGIPLA